ncbi:hypothetical protein V5G65_07560 [Mammaliicoccus sciuri]|uniref:hypothetical protein n=1 Tax=Mammaliicoccus sciuri TaxID=1296 RepID=UPI0037B39C03
MIICFEGIDGTGKSSLAKMTYNYFISKNVYTELVEWNSNDYINNLFEYINNENIYNINQNVSLLIGNLLGNIEQYINVSKKGVLILDRYVYTMLSRDVVRGANEKYLKKVKELIPNPDIIIWCDASNQTIYERLLIKNNYKINFWETGLEIGYEEKIKTRINEYYNEEFDISYVRKKTSDFMDKVRFKYEESFENINTIKIDTDVHNKTESFNFLIKEVMEIYDISNNSFKL